MSLISRHLIVFLLCYANLDLTIAAQADDNLKKPHQVIADLRQRMYAIGETTGRFDDFVKAEQKAASDIRSYIANGNPAGLIEKNNIGQTPLMAAAFMGYPEIVNELLKSENVRESINEINPKGITAWQYATFAFRQTMWVCNPTAFNDPFSWVPLLVTQPYYIQSPENPYRKTRRLLEDAGATPNQEHAKKFWQETCKLQSEDTRTKIQESTDILETLLSEGAATLANFLAQSKSKVKPNQPLQRDAPQAARP